MSTPKYSKFLKSTRSPKENVTVDLPIIINEGNNIKIIKKGSYFIFNFFYDYKSKTNHLKSVYKHAILNTDISILSNKNIEFPVRKTISDIKVIKIEKITEKFPEYKNIIQNIYSTDLLFMDNENTEILEALKKIKKYVKSKECEGIIGMMGGVLLYSITNNLKIINKKISYKLQNIFL